MFTRERYSIFLVFVQLPWPKFNVTIDIKICVRSGKIYTGKNVILSQFGVKVNLLPLLKMLTEVQIKCSHLTDAISFKSVLTRFYELFHCLIIDSQAGTVDTSHLLYTLRQLLIF